MYAYTIEITVTGMEITRGTHLSPPREKDQRKSDLSGAIFFGKFHMHSTTIRRQGYTWWLLCTNKSHQVPRWNNLNLPVFSASEKLKPGDSRVTATWALGENIVTLESLGSCTDPVTDTRRDH